MPAPLTPYQKVAEALFRRIDGGELAAFVAERRNSRPRWSWRLLADELHTLTEIEVTGEALRQWYSDREPEAAAS